MIKKGIRFLGFTLLLIIVFGIYKYNFGNKAYPPYPYTFKIEKTNFPIQTLYPNKKVDVLIIGDRMAENFFNYAKILSTSISKTKNINIGLLANKNDGLHRTFYYLKSLKTLPKIVLYIGGSNEEYELKFRTSDIKKIEKNFSYLENPYLATLFYYNKNFARFFMKNIPQVPLTKAIVNTIDQLSHEDIQNRTTLSYKLYSYELSDLIDYIKSKKSIPILITTPTNLEIPPIEVCENSYTTELSKTIVKIKKLMAKGDYKSAQYELSEVIDVSPGNAEINFLMGKLLDQLNNKSADFYYKLAASLDCKRYKTNPVYAQIVRKVAQEKEVLLFDYAKILEEERRKNTTFLDSIFPQILYGQKANNLLGTYLESAFN